MAKSIDIIISTILKKTGIDAARAHLKAFAKSAAENLANVKAGFDMMSGVVTKFASVFKTAIGEAFKFEKAKSDFVGLLNSVDSAQKHIEDLRKFASSTPLTFGDLSQASKLLLSFGSDVETVIPSLKMLGDISMGDSQKFQGLALVFAQVKSAGKLMGQDLMQMVNQGFNPLTIIAQKTGRSMADLKDMMGKGAISFEMVAEAMRIATSEGGLFNNALENASKTGEGLISTLQDKWTDVVRTFGEQFADSAKGGIQLLIDKMTELVENGDVEFWADKVVSSFSRIYEGAAQVVGPLSKIVSVGWSSVKAAYEATGQAVGNMVGTAAGGGSLSDILKSGWQGAKAGVVDAFDLDGAQKRFDDEMKDEISARKRESARRKESKKAVAEAKKDITTLLAEAEAEASAKSAAAAEKAAKKAAEAELREREKIEKKLHDQRVRDLKYDIQTNKMLGDAERNAVDVAKTEFEKSFAMYRDRDLAEKTIKEERDYAAAYKQLGKDANRYGGKWRIDTLADMLAVGDTKGVSDKLEEWRKSRGFTPEVESMVRAAAADKTRTTAEDELRKIQANTADLADKLDELLAMKGGE